MGRVESVEVDDFHRPIVTRRAAVVPLGRSAARRGALLGSGAERGQRDVDRRRARAHLHRRGRRFERLLDDADVVGARRQVEDAVAAVLRVDGVGDAVDRIVRLDAQGAHLAAVSGHAAADHAGRIRVLGKCEAAGQRARTDQQGRRYRQRREAVSMPNRHLDAHGTSPFGPRVSEGQRRPTIVACGSDCRPTGPDWESTPFYGADSQCTSARCSSRSASGAGAQQAAAAGLSPRIPASLRHRTG